MQGQKGSSFPAEASSVDEHGKSEFEDPVANAAWESFNSVEDICEVMLNTMHTQWNQVNAVLVAGREQLRHENEKLKSGGTSHAALKAKVSELEKENRDLRITLTSTTKDLASFTERHLQMQQKSSETLSGVQDEVAALAAEKESLRQQIDTWHSVKDGLRSEINELRLKNEKTWEERNHLMGKLHSTEQLLAEEKTHRTAALQNLSTARSRIESLEKELASAQSTLKHTQEQMNMQKEILAEKEEEIVRAARSFHEVEVLMKREKASKEKAEEIAMTREMEIKRERRERRKAQKELWDHLGIKGGTDEDSDMQVMEREREDLCRQCNKMFKVHFNTAGECVWHPSPLQKHCKPCNRWIPASGPGAGICGGNALGNCWYDAFRWGCCSNADQYSIGCTVGKHVCR
jgi:chromosome segregation ATPase